MSIQDLYHQRYIDKMGNVIGVRYEGPVGNQRRTEYNLGLGGMTSPVFEPNTGTLELPSYSSATPVPIDPGNFQLPFYHGTDRGVDPEDFLPFDPPSTIDRDREFDPRLPDRIPDKDKGFPSLPERRPAYRREPDVVGEAASTAGRFLGEFLRKRLG